MTPEAQREQTRLSWNAATVAHNSHKRDQAAHLRGGGSTLFPEELKLLGDVRDQRLLHLQCNAGQDTVSLALRGAMVTGVDFSDTAIDFARRLAADVGVAADFVCADVYDYLPVTQRAGARFEIVFCSYGALCWLPDLKRWAHGVAGVLKPGGRLVLVEFHPVWMMFDEHFQLQYDYFGNAQPALQPDGIGDYVALSGDALAPSGYEAGQTDFTNPHPAYEYQWHLGVVLQALASAGLLVTAFEEYPYSNGLRVSEDMRAGPGRRWYPPEGMPSLPLMYGVVAKGE
jgi:SAM-dependent methyltransferase